jgi:hypothetical protein
VHPRIRHLPTAFGYDVRLDLLAQQAQVNVAHLQWIGSSPLPAHLG